MTTSFLSLDELQAYRTKTPVPSLADFDTSHINKAAKPFVLVDGSYYLFRCFHGMPPLSTKNGLPTNAIRGVLNALSKLINKYTPSHMAIAFDTKAPTFRHTLSQDYKANRPPMDEDLAIQIPYIHALIKALGIPLIELAGFEADDIIGTLAYRACQNGYPVVISTGDKDMTQLVNDCVILEDSFKEVITDYNGVLSKFGIRPNQIRDYLTLMGDASDGIMGVPKVGAKTATRLLSTYDTLDNIVAHADEIGGIVGKNLASHSQQIAFDKILATIVTDLDLPYQYDDFELYKSRDDLSLFVLYDHLEFVREFSQIQHKLDNKLPQTLPSIDQIVFGKSQNNDQSPNNNPNNQSTQKNYQHIDRLDEFNQLISTLHSVPYFAVDTETTAIDWQTANLVGISICYQKGQAFYIPLGHSDEFGNLLTNQLDKTTVLTHLRPLLENPAIGKIGQHLKYDRHIFANEGINLNGWQMDTMLASYCLNAAASKHNLEALALHYLNAKSTSFEQIAGKGKKQLTFNQIALDVATDYACEDADLALQLFEKFNELFKTEQSAYTLLNNLEMPVAKILGDMERLGILVHRKFLMELSARFDQQIRQLENLAHNLADEAFNLASPKQLGEILFDKLGIAGGKKTKTGQYSTSEEILANIEHPLAETVLEYRSLSKLKSAYADALGKVCDQNGRVHTSYHQALTSTGRLSSSDPNLQNIPIRTDTGRLIREAFIAPTGRVILAADYSQIELRLMAHFSGDKGLIDAFHQGIDIHTKTASEILGKPIEQITPMERRSAKAVNFGLLYGMSAFGLAKQLGIARDEAKRYIDSYFASYPTIYDYMESTKQQAINEGCVQTLLGRKLYMPDVQSSNRLVKEAALRAAINAPLQGSAADIIKLAMIAVDKVLPKQHASLLLQVHDELVFEVDEHKAEEIGNLIKNAMQSVLETTAKELGFDAWLAVPLVVEIGIGANWEVAH